MEGIILKNLKKCGFESVQRQAEDRRRVTRYIEKWETWGERSRNEGFLFWKKESGRSKEDEKKRESEADIFNERRMKRKYVATWKDLCLIY